MRNLIFTILLGAIFFSCGPEKPKEKAEGEDSYESIHGDDAQNTPVVDEGKGFGQVTEVTLNTPLEQDRIPRGKAIYEMKCQACHRTDDQRVVGPGWKDVTKRRKPEWIMNMITDVDVMLEKTRKRRSFSNYVLPECQTKMFPWETRVIF